MKFDQAIFWYRDGRFTADDVTRATGLSEAAQRLLLKIGVLHAVPQAKTKQRLLDTRMVKRAAVIAPLSKSGLSLQVSGKIVASALMLEDLLFDLIDPWDAVFDASGEFDHETKLFPRRAQFRDCDRWLEPDASKYTEEDDYLISVVDNRFVAIHDLRISGELTPDQTDFVWWDDAMYDDFRDRAQDGVLQLSVRGTRDHWGPLGRFNSEDSPKTIEFNVKTPTDHDKEEAVQARESPVALLTINASLSLRLALRRLLYIDAVTED